MLRSQYLMYTQIVHAEELDQSSVANVQAEAKPEELGIKALGIDGSGIIFQVINFLILYYFLNRFLFKPVVKMLDERQKKIKDAEVFVQKIDKDMAQWEETHQKSIRKTKLQADAILQDAKSNAHEQGEKIIIKASGEAKRITDRALAEIVTEKEKMIISAKKELVDLAIDIAEKSLKGKIDRSANKKFIEKNV